MDTHPSPKNFDQVLADYAQRTGQPLGTVTRTLPGVDGHPASVEEFVRTIAPFAPRHDGSYMTLGELVTKYELTLDGGARVFIEVRS